MKGSKRNTKLGSFEEIPFLKDILSKTSMRGEVGVDVSKVWAILVLLFDSFKTKDFNLTGEQQGHSPTECISGTVFTTGFVFEHKCVRLEIFYPPSMSGIQLLLGIEVL